VYPAPPKGIFPFLISLNPPRDIYNAVSIVSFATRLRSSGGAFYDFTARYGALRDEERITLRESLLSGHTKNGAPIGSPAVEEMSEHLQLRGLLDIPLIALSNGQIRRARILRELLERPKVLVLDEPLSMYINILRF
jgi:ABC-type sugar transport system ATPase subunit